MAENIESMNPSAELVHTMRNTRRSLQRKYGIVSPEGGVHDVSN